MNKANLSLILLLLATTASAQNFPIPTATDQRIKKVSYQENNVIPLHGMVFTTTQIQFANNERVLDIEGGDSSAWMVTYHPELSNMLFVKPTMLDSSTNMTVITNQHTYYFHLISAKERGRKKTYALHFIYPMNHQQQTQSSESRPSESGTFPLAHAHDSDLHPVAPLNTAYRFSGSPQLLPKRVFDDGQFTYFELSPNGAVPAIVAVDDPSGKESTVNTRRSGKYLVVQRIAPQFTLRQGTLATSVFNSQEINRITQNRRPT